MTWRRSMYLSMASCQESDVGRAKERQSRRNLRSRSEFCQLPTNSAAVRENVLLDVIVGRGALPFAETVGLQFTDGFLPPPLVVFHAVNGPQHAGPVQTRAA